MHAAPAAVRLSCTDRNNFVALLEPAAGTRANATIAGFANKDVFRALSS